MMNNKSNALWPRARGCRALIFKVEETTRHECTVGGQPSHQRANTTVTMTRHHISCSVSITGPFIPKDSASSERKYATHSWEELSVSVFFLPFVHSTERKREGMSVCTTEGGKWSEALRSLTKGISEHGWSTGKAFVLCFSKEQDEQDYFFFFFFKVPHCSLTSERFHICLRPWQMVLLESLERPLKFFSQSGFCLSSTINIHVSMSPEIEMDIIIHGANGHFIQSFF